MYVRCRPWFRPTLYLSRFLESCFCFDYLLYFLSYVGSRDLAAQWAGVHNQNKQRFILNETFKSMCAKWIISFIDYIRHADKDQAAGSVIEVGKEWHENAPQMYTYKNFILTCLGACCVCAGQPELQGHPNLGLGHPGRGWPGRGNSSLCHAAQGTAQVV